MSKHINETYPVVKYLIIFIVGLSIVSFPASVFLAKYFKYINFVSSEDASVAFFYIIIEVLLYLLISKYLYIKNFKEKYILLCISAISAAAYLFICFKYYYVTYGDFEQIRDAGWAMSRGEYNVSNFLAHDYMYMYNWQTGMAVLQSIFMRIFGIYSVYVFKFGSAVCQLMSTILIYFIAKRHF
ncbi:MAG: hypothetical protein HUJ90_00375, partial [Bacteroidales bacterium]|nr:hypothetical protein [Bacteroidales bacterium]